MTKAFSGLWREGFSNSRPQECWLEAQSRVQLDRAGYQGFQLNSGESIFLQGMALRRQVQALPAYQLKPGHKLTRDEHTVMGKKTSLVRPLGQEVAEWRGEGRPPLWSMVLDNELPSGARVLF